MVQSPMLKQTVVWMNNCTSLDLLMVPWTRVMWLIIIMISHEIYISSLSTVSIC